MTSSRVEAYQDLLVEQTVRSTVADRLVQDVNHLATATTALRNLLGANLPAGRPEVVDFQVVARVRDEAGVITTHTLNIEVKHQTDQAGGPHLGEHQVVDAEPRCAVESTAAAPAQPERPDHAQADTPVPQRVEDGAGLPAEVRLAEDILNWFRDRPDTQASIRRVQDELNNSRTEMPRVTDEEIRVAWRIARVRDDRLKPVSRKSWAYQSSDGDDIQPQEDDGE